MAGTDIELYRRVGEGGELSGLDSRLLELAAQRFTPEQMAAELGVPSLTPARCAQRVREILRSQDFLSVRDQKAMLLLDLVRLRDILFDRVEGSDTKVTKHGDIIEVEPDSRHASNLIRLLREWRSVIESMQADVDSSTVKINQATADVMMSAITVMFDRFILRLEARGISIPKRELMEIMEEVMPLGFKALEERQEHAA